LPNGLSDGGAPGATDDGGTEDGRAAFESGSADAGTPPSDSGVVPDGEAGAPVVNLLSNADFTLGCAGWEIVRGTTANSTIARSGTGACQICGTDSYLEFSQEVPLETVPGQRYYGEIWVRSAQPDGGPALGLGVVNELSGGGNEDPVVTTGPASTTTWTQVTALLTVHTTGVGVTLLVSVADSQSHCLLVDDAVVGLLK
jgi:hypothetical protein